MPNSVFQTVPSLSLSVASVSHSEWAVPDPRAGARIRSSTPGRMLSVSQMEDMFHHYSHVETVEPSGCETYPSLSYEGFLAGIVDCSARTIPETRFLSEAVRAFISKYVLRAKRITAPGIIKTRVKTPTPRKAIGRKKSTTKI